MLDPGEGPISGATVSITGTGGTFTTTTDATGSYTFAGLAPGTYTVNETQPAGYLDGKDSAGSSGGVVTNDQIANVSLAGGDNATGYDFGELAPASIRDKVWTDTNGNGIQDPGEPGIAGATVALTGTDDFGSVTATTTTDSSGRYSFANLRPGTYTVAFTTPAGGYLPSAANAGSDDSKDSDGASATVTLTAGVTDSSVDSGFFQPASLAGHVYVDANNNGVMNAGEAPIANATVTLAGTDGAGNPVNRTTTTDVAGAYSFTGLAPGTYTVAETQPAGYLDGRDANGSLSGTWRMTR